MRNGNRTMFYVSIMLAVIGGVSYHFFIRRVPASLSPVVAVIGIYVAVLLLGVTLLPFFPPEGGLAKHFRQLSWVHHPRLGRPRRRPRRPGHGERPRRPRRTVDGELVGDGELRRRLQQPDRETPEQEAEREQEKGLAGQTGGAPGPGRGIVVGGMATPHEAGQAARSRVTRRWPDRRLGDPLRRASAHLTAPF